MYVSNIQMNKLKKKIEDLVIIGGGYVGLPLAIEFAKKFSVICFDIDNHRINNLKKGLDLNQQHKKKEILKNNLIFTNDLLLLKNKKIYIITVPTPINHKNQPDLKMLIDASKMIGRLITRNSIVVYESTTFPGCTEEICIPILEKKSKLICNKDFNVAYSPERVNPGDSINKLKNITKIVGANDSKTLLYIKKMYSIICKSVYAVKSIKIAESAKVIENIQRDVNIALINEFSVLFNRLQIPTNEVLKAASTKWNFHYYKPGLVGGHCISVDPYYLAYKAKKKNYLPKLILSGRKFNEDMSKYVAKSTLRLMKKNKIEVNKSKVAVLGFSFKENIPDIRNTKIINVINDLKKRGMIIRVFDSVVKKEEVARYYKFSIYKFNRLKNFKFDAIILAVSHKEFLKKIIYYNAFYKNKKKKIFIDLKNNYSSYELEKNNFKFFQL
jgi:UDP-N-acetyl-D-galactosamine dehydrogenase